jgi:hypothetical protein
MIPLLWQSPMDTFILIYCLTKMKEVDNFKMIINVTLLQTNNM